MEDAVRTGRNGFVAEHAARADDPDRRAHPLHGADLHGRGMGTEQDRIVAARLHEERVLHVAGGMLRREVECAEHVPVIFDFRAFRHRIAELAEDRNDLLACDRNRMARAKFLQVTGFGQVEGSGGRADHFGEGGPQLLDLGRGRVLEGVQPLAEFPFLVLVHLTELVEQLGNLAFLAEPLHAQLFDLLFLGSLQLLDGGHHLFNLLVGNRHSSSELGHKYSDYPLPFNRFSGERHRHAACTAATAGQL